MTSPRPVRSHLRRFRRAHADLTQQALAERVGVTRQTILSVERGRYLPSIELALRLARVFGVRVEELFELDDDRGDEPTAVTNDGSRGELPGSGGPGRGD